MIAEGKENMIILPNSPEISIVPVEIESQPHATVSDLPTNEYSDRQEVCPDLVRTEILPLPETEISVSESFPVGEDFANAPSFAPVFGENPSFGGSPLLGTFFPGDLPPFVITNSFDDDEDDDDDMDEVPDEEDEDVYEEVETFEDFDDEFDEDFEDEFDEDYEDLAKIDDEELDEETEGDVEGTPARYEEEFGDVDGQVKFIPDGAEIALNEEVLLSEDDLDESDTSDFDEFEEDEETEQFDEFDN